MNFALMDALECSCGEKFLSLENAVLSRVSQPALPEQVLCTTVCGYKKRTIASGGVSPADCQECRSHTIRSGFLHCSCGREWPIVEGVAEFSPDSRHAVVATDGLRVVKIDTTSDPRWRHFVRAHSEATIYHHPLWLEVLTQEYSQPQFSLACEERDGLLHGLLPLVYTRGLPTWVGGARTAHRLSSLPRTPLAGPLAIDKVSMRALVRAALELAQKDSTSQLELKTQEAGCDAACAGLQRVPWRSSYVLSFPENPADFRLGDSAKHRHRIKGAVKKALESGLQVRPAENEDELRQWYEIYLDTMRRKVVPPRPFRLFAAMWQLLRPRGLMQLLLAEKQDINTREIIAGSIFLKFGSRVFYAFTGCRQRDFVMHPHDLIQWHAIHEAVQQGYRYYDFGEVAEDSQSLAQFKSKWGTREERLHRYYYPAPRNLDPGSLPMGGLANHLVDSVWQRLPLPATARMGEFIYKYL